MGICDTHLSRHEPPSERPYSCPKSTAHTSPVTGFCDGAHTGHLLGYARVSTADQQPQLQIDALTAAGSFRVFTETASGARSDRPTSSRSWTRSAASRRRSTPPPQAASSSSTCSPPWRSSNATSSAAAPAPGWPRLGPVAARRPTVGADRPQAPGAPEDGPIWGVHGGGDRHDPGGQPRLDLPPPRHHPLAYGERVREGPDGRRGVQWDDNAVMVGEVTGGEHGRPVKVQPGSG